MKTHPRKLVVKIKYTHLQDIASFSKLCSNEYAKYVALQKFLAHFGFTQWWGITEMTIRLDFSWGDSPGVLPKFGNVQLFYDHIGSVQFFPRNGCSSRIFRKNMDNVQVLFKNHPVTLGITHVNFIDLNSLQVCEKRPKKQES